MVESIEKEKIIFKQNKLYLLDSYLFEIQTKVLDKKILEEKQQEEILLEDNIFHPQGGGQPSDEGFIKLDQKLFQIKEFKQDKVSDLIYFIIDKSDQIQIGSTVQLQINQEKRKKNIKLHSAGHLLDIAVKKQNLDWTPGKGYHFEDGSYVEYIGKIEPDLIQNLTENLNKQCEQIINEAKEENQAISKQYQYEEAKKLFKVPNSIPEGSNLRYVQLTKEDEGCPCGGTHVRHVKEIGGIIITKIQKKGKNVRVSYTIK